jgi:4-amino-4-deoxy-L-arabinose transferase-like glycosyltransferase
LSLTKPHNIYWWMFIPLMFLLIALGSRGLHQVLWVDEVRSLYRAGDPVFGGVASPAQVWQRTAEQFDQVPGYYFVLAAWSSVVGLSHFAGRYLSILLGLLAVACTYRLGRDLHSPLAGLGAAVALCASAIFVNHLHNMRTYILLVLLSALLIWLYWRVAMVREAGWLAQISLTLCIAGLLYSHYFNAILIGALCLYHLLFVRKDRHWWRITGLIAVGGALFLPWVVTSFSATSLEDANMVIRTANAFTPVETVQQALDNFSNGSIALWIFVALFSFGGRSRRPAPTDRAAVRLVWFVLVASLLLGIAVNSWLYVLSQANYLMMLWVPLALVVGFGVARLKEIGLKPVYMLGVWLVIGVVANFDPRVQNVVNPPLKYLPWNILSQTLEGRAQDGDVLAFQTAVQGWTGDPEPVMNYYFHDSPLDLELLESLPIMTDAEYVRRAEEAVGVARRVWASYDPEYRPWRMSIFESSLTEAGYVSCGIVSDTPELFLELYTQPSDEVTARFSEDITLHLAELLAKGDALYVTLEWNVGENVPPNTYSVGLHVTDESGALVAQADYGLLFGCVSTTITTSQLASGTYNVQAVVYAWETGERLRLNGEDAALLGTFRVG